MAELTERAKAFRMAITAFINERRDAKLKGKEEDAATAAKYDYATWLTDAAHRANNLRVVTHPIKFTHSAIKGASSINFQIKGAPLYDEIGTHSALSDFNEDFSITDAKHLDVYSFLKEVVDGKRLLDWVLDNDPDLMSALHDDPDTASDMMSSFQCVTRKEKKMVSHGFAKQVYWLIGSEPMENGQYHLLQPMFSSTLEHVVHGEIRKSRDAAFAARGTKKQKATYADHYTYPNLVARTIGGSNAQNVSPLNKTRGGVNYLLPSLPPVWNKAKPIKLLNVESVWTAFFWFDEVRHQVRSLADFLLSVADQPSVMSIRDQRKFLEQELGQQLAIFGVYVADTSKPGWTRDPACRLPLCEQLWLDPERTELPLRKDHMDEDEAFNAAYIRGGWPDEVAGRFASWLNSHLHEAGLTSVGDAEYRHWAKQAIIDTAWPVTMQRYAAGGHA